MTRVILSTMKVLKKEMNVLEEKRKEYKEEYEAIKTQFDLLRKMNVIEQLDSLTEEYKAYGLDGDEDLIGK